MRKFRLRACGITYEEVEYEMDVEAASVADAVAPTASLDHKWIFCDAVILEVNVPNPQDYYGDSGNWEFFEIMPDGSEKQIIEEDEEVSA